MIFTREFVFIATLLSLSNAGASTASLRKLQETTLGASFLATAKNYTTASPTTQTETKSGSFSASDLAVSAIGPLADAIDPLCDQFDGYVESKSQVGSDTGTISYSVTCRFPADKYDAFEDAVVALLGDYSYSYSFSSYMDGSYYYSNPAIYVAQQKALENLMVSATTIADLMLVFSAWQSAASSAQIYSISNSPTSSISISLSETYNNYPSSPFPYPLHTASYVGMVAEAGKYKKMAHVREYSEKMSLIAPMEYEEKQPISP